ncbi:hypothetical protein L873DRAFT_1238709 [Choiromyces venosus 120613-1]|uniref:Uncharacterized protein n=1 Tax=Choiromyces venosus 120613-1 TaxID=1336337 RepID=A0A3N4JIY7_9PEZI|nr:hypothetical protein L873DRAFT_1238709 [Choiromyces venosus 120613-1]
MTSFVASTVLGLPSQFASKIWSFIQHYSSSIGFKSGEFTGQIIFYYCIPYHSWYLVVNFAQCDDAPSSIKPTGANCPVDDTEFLYQKSYRMGRICVEYDAAVILPYVE